jgi:hypothetical protein
VIEETEYFRNDSEKMITSNVAFRQTPERHKVMNYVDASQMPALGSKKNT